MPAPITTQTKSRPIAWSAAMLGASLFAACLGLGEDDGPKIFETRYKGRLSTLDRIVDTTTRTEEWHLVVDAQEPHQLRGECNYTAWLGDSSQVESESTEGLYTNTQMGNITLSAETIRSQGIKFYLYPEHAGDRVLTFYRVDFKCSY